MNSSPVWLAISFLSEEEQYELHAVMELEQSIPNISQANRLKRMSQQKCLDMCKRSATDVR